MTDSPPPSPEPRRKAPLRRRLFYWLLRLYPPFLGAGIVPRARPDLARFDVAMFQLPWNRNVFGTHFGGSLYSMCDPFFVLILAEQLGRDYIVWDKAAKVRFLRPGRGTVRATFEIDPAEIDRVRAEADAAGKAEPTYTVQVKNRDGEVVAEIEKLLHVRRKREQDP